jgi:hypothetical protein
MRSIAALIGSGKLDRFHCDNLVGAGDLYG